MNRETLRRSTLPYFRRMRAALMVRTFRGFAAKAAWTDFCDRFVIYPFNDAVAWQAAEIFNDLRKRGVMTGENDLWIAATALESGGALVTRNVKHFREIRGLKVLVH